MHAYCDSTGVVVELAELGPVQAWLSLVIDVAAATTPRTAAPKLSHLHRNPAPKLGTGAEPAGTCRSTPKRENCRPGHGSRMTPVKWPAWTPSLGEWQSGEAWSE